MVKIKCYKIWLFERQCLVSISIVLVIKLARSGDRFFSCNIFKANVLGCSSNRNVTNTTTLAKIVKKTLTYFQIILP